MIPKCIKQKQLEDKVNSIIETITNNNGTAIKFSNGIMICYAKISGNFEQSTWGSLYSYSLNDIIYPDSFISEPIVEATVANGQGGGTGAITRVITSKTKIDGISLIRPTEYNSGLFYFNYIAIGRWK